MQILRQAMVALAMVGLLANFAFAHPIHDGTVAAHVHKFAKTDFPVIADSSPAVTISPHEAAIAHFASGSTCQRTVTTCITCHMNRGPSTVHAALAYFDFRRTLSATIVVPATSQRSTTMIPAVTASPPTQAPNNSSITVTDEASWRTSLIYAAKQPLPNARSSDSDATYLVLRSTAETPTVVTF